MINSKHVVFSFIGVGENSIVASARIARFVSDELKLPIVTDKNIDEVRLPLKMLIIVNGAFAFCRCLEKLAELIRTAERVVWVQNDYTIIPPTAESGATSPFRKAFRDRRAGGMPHIDYWTTVGPNSVATPLSSYVNWNCLTFDLDVTDKMVAAGRSASASDLFYYGSYRVGRQNEFDRYFASPTTDVTISNPGLKGKNKFAERYKSDKIQHWDKLEGDLSVVLVRHGLGLYIEDKKSHSEFHSPANRFYEMLSAGLPMVFQPECGSTMRKAGYDPEPYFARNSREVLKLMKDHRTILRRQREQWLERARNERLDLRARLQAAHAKMEDRG